MYTVCSDHFGFVDLRLNILAYSSEPSNAPMTSDDILIMDSTVATCLHCYWVKDLDRLHGEGRLKGEGYILRCQLNGIHPL